MASTTGAAPCWPKPLPAFPGAPDRRRVRDHSTSRPTTGASSRAAYRSRTRCRTRREENGCGVPSRRYSSPSTQAVRGSTPGRTWNVLGSGTTTKSPAPTISATPSPGSARKSIATACPVSKTNGPGLKSIPLRSTDRNAATVSVLDRASPCGSPNTSRTRSTPASTVSTWSAIACCSADHNPNPATKPVCPTLPPGSGELHDRVYTSDPPLEVGGVGPDRADQLDPDGPVDRHRQRRLPGQVERVRRRRPGQPAQPLEPRWR